MDVREKLVGLIKKASYECDEGARDLWDMKEAADSIADFLITNGVTAQEWISVDERLPDDNDMVIAFRPNESETSAYKYCVMWGWSVKVSLKQHRGITHWMPLPHPTKGE